MDRDDWWDRWDRWDRGIWIAGLRFGYGIGRRVWVRAVGPRFRIFGYFGSHIRPAFGCLSIQHSPAQNLNKIQVPHIKNERLIRTLR